MSEYMKFFSEELKVRMNLPQRHRLLHGYPMAPLMEACVPKLRRFNGFDQEQRGLIVGVLPHPFCNPKVEGCGFCTFPHSQFNKEMTQKTCAAVITEIRSFSSAHPVLCQRPIEAIYFGGGTANLTPWSELQSIVTAADRHFEIRNAELTLEGVPVYFALNQFELLDSLSELREVRHKRISMGLQSFDPRWLKEMGREAFGDAALFESIVNAAHERGMTLSCDILCNLPGQNLEDMKADLHKAIDMGFDQICLYHLVLFKGLDVPWARDSEKLDTLPQNEIAFENWRILRALLLDSNYVQTSLTNFERGEVNNSEQRFRYEDASYSPLDFDFLGFGPGAISSLSKAWEWGEAVFLKTMNPSNPDRYVANVDKHGTGHDKRFHGINVDAALLFLTRSLAKMGYKRERYPFSGFPVDFPEAWRAVEAAGLVLMTDDEVQLTEKGMFYADSVVGLTAWPRTQRLRGFENTLSMIDKERSAAFGADMSMG